MTIAAKASAKIYPVSTLIFSDSLLNDAKLDSSDANVVSILTRLSAAFTPSRGSALSQATLRRVDARELKRLNFLMRQAGINERIIPQMVAQIIPCCQVLLAIGNKDNSARAQELLFEGARHGRPSQIAFALDQGGEIDKIGQFNRTPLAMAIENNRVDAVRVLLRRGANPNMPNNNYTPLIHAAERSPSCISLLIKAGADVNGYSANRDNTPLIAGLAGEYDSVTLLLKAGANPNLPVVRVVNYRLGENIGDTVPVQESTGNTPLMILMDDYAEMQDFEILEDTSKLRHIVRLLLRYGANPEEGNSEGVSALTVAQNNPILWSVLKDIFANTAIPLLPRSIGE